LINNFNLPTLQKLKITEVLM